MSKNDGGPAFPVPVAATPDGRVYHSMQVGGRALGGMTLRDYFAAKAMTAMIGTAAAPCLLGLAGGEPQTAEAAYKIADAMLAEREKDSQP